MKKASAKKRILPAARADHAQQRRAASRELGAGARPEGQLRDLGLERDCMQDVVCAMSALVVDVTNKKEGKFACEKCLTKMFDKIAR